MKTTEIFVEQVIIGFLVLLIAALPFYPAVMGQSKLVEGWGASFSFAAAAVGAAYLLGIVFERFADSLVAGLTEYQRRRIADPGHWWGRYPEARLRIAILRAGGSSAEWHDYLRSRVRLSRAFAVFLPGLSFAGVLALRPELPRWWLAMVLAAYVAALVVPAPKRNAAKTRREVERLLIKLRRAYQGANASEAEAKDFSAKLDSIFDELKKRATGVRFDLVRPGLALFLGLLAMVLAWRVAGDTSATPGSFPHLTTDSALLLAAGGVALTALAGWAWWRINQTYLTYLENFDRFRKTVAE